MNPEYIRMVITDALEDGYTAKELLSLIKDAIKDKTGQDIVIILI